MAQARQGHQRDSDVITFKSHLEVERIELMQAKVNLLAAFLTLASHDAANEKMVDWTPVSRVLKTMTDLLEIDISREFPSVDVRADGEI